MSPYEQDNIRTYLVGGGGILISSQGMVDFWEGPLRTMLRIESFDYAIGKDSVAGIASNPIGDGLSFTITGGSGAGNQYMQSAVNPMSFGKAVFDCMGYSGGSAGLMCHVSSLWAAVTFGFGFEAISDAVVRDTVMNRVIQWLENLTGIHELRATGPVPKLRLCAPTPNPCRGSATLRFSIPTKCRATLSIYNCLGQKVKTLLDCSHNAGHESLGWDCTDMNGRSVANGTYFCTLDASKQRRTKKVKLIR